MTLVDPRPGLRTWLLGSPAIAALIGTRVFPLKMPQGEKRTSVVYTRISGQGDHHNTGPSGLMQTRMQFDCWAASLDEANRLADLVKERLDGFRGTMPDTSSPPIDLLVRGVFFQRESENYDDSVALHRVSRDYFIWYAEF